MDISFITKVLKTAAIYFFLILIISFVLDSGFAKLSSEPLGQVFGNWFSSIMIWSKLGMWIAFSVVFSFIRNRQYLQK